MIEMVYWFIDDTESTKNEQNIIQVQYEPYNR